jgi:hypothetical protein
MANARWLGVLRRVSNWRRSFDLSSGLDHITDTDQWAMARHDDLRHLALEWGPDWEARFHSQAAQEEVSKNVVMENGPFGVSELSLALAHRIKSIQTDNMLRLRAHDEQRKP